MSGVQLYTCIAWVMKGPVLPLGEESIVPSGCEELKCMPGLDKEQK